MILSNVIGQLDLAVDWLGIRAVEQEITTFTARDGKNDGYRHEINRGWMVEVLVGGQFAAAATQLGSVASLRAAALRAKAIATTTNPHAIYQFDNSFRPGITGNYDSAIYFPNYAFSRDLFDLAIGATKDLQVSGQIISSSARVVISKTNCHLVSTNGADINQTFTNYGIFLSATANVGQQIQTRTNNEFYSRDATNLFDRELLRAEAHRIGTEAILLAAADNCPTGNLDLILMPDQLYLQVHESIGHPLELDRILGDERNYAGWSFINPGDFGNLQYGSSLLNITYDPTITTEIASYDFDDIGDRALKEYLIRDGKLVRGIGSLESQKRLNIPGVAAARASSWNRLPIDRMVNINLEPGNTSLREMISQTERGIMMQTNKSWSIDDYRRKFQFGCEYAQLIEDGQLTRIVKNPNYRGITLPFWHKLKAVGNRDTFEVRGTPYCGKGEPNQLVMVGHGVPACLFSNVEVFGGDC